MRNLSQYPLQPEEAIKDLEDVREEIKKDLGFGSTKLLSISLITEYLIDDVPIAFSRWLRDRQHS